MSEHLEIEFKNLLTKEEFQKLQAYFSIKDEDFFLQENDYFDTTNFSLKQLGCALRIRKKAENLEFTLKEPKEIGLLETNESISKEDREKLIQNIQFPSGEIANKLKDHLIPLDQIAYFGTLKTHRKELPYKGGLLVLDKSFYLNKEDFELEYEVDNPEEGYQHFSDLLNLLQIPKRKSINKIQRFYNRKKELQQGKI